MENQMRRFGFLNVPTGGLAGQNFGDQSKPLMITNSMISGENLDVVDEDGAVSDSESSIVAGCRSEENRKKIGTFDDGLIRVEAGDREHETIKRSVLAGLSSWGLQTQIKAIHRLDYSGFRKSAKLQAFQVFANAMEQSFGGDANVKYAWYGASKDEIMKVVSHGFCGPSNNRMFGRGVYLSPVEHILDSLQSTIVDEDGVRHLILCRVLMGQMEQVPAGSEQCYPSSKDFDSGVDNLANPRKYIVWGSHMNTHIMPKFVISIGNVNNTRESKSQRVSVPKSPVKQPNSPWLPFPTLISELSRFLQPQSIDLIKKFNNDHKERKLSRIELVQRVRRIAGDELLASVIKSYRHKVCFPLTFTINRLKLHCDTSSSKHRLVSPYLTLLYW
ncbi:hypothetical protein Leryth_012022 [Lithospermum erythrorhizon]|nr:hypothetical protein Leryth_012022 [Lithospermum erythrorhizon]